MPEVNRQRRRENLKRLLDARSVVFVGGRNIINPILYCRDLGYPGEIYAVNPHREEIAGVSCVPSLADLPKVPDAAYVAVPAEAAIEVTEQLRQMGCPGVVCYAAGFAELGEDGLDLQSRLIAAADDIALIGPNTTGLIHFRNRLALKYANHGLTVPRRGVSMITQSGTVGGNALGSDRSLPVNLLLSVGNQATLDIADAVAVAAEDEGTQVILLHLEGIRDASALAEALDLAHDRDIPVIAYRTGLSAKAREIAVSHTGGMTGAGQLLDCFLRRQGVLIAESFESFLETGKLLCLHPKGFAGPDVAVLTASGADAGACADLAQAHGLQLPAIERSSQEDLQNLLPAIAKAGNPLDITMVLWSDRDGQIAAYSRLLAEGFDAALLVINYFVQDREPAPEYGWALEAFDAATTADQMPKVVISNLPEGLPEAARQWLWERGIVPLQGLEAGFAAIASAVKRGSGRMASAPLTVRPQAEAGAKIVLDEAHSKAWLKDRGLPVPRAVGVLTAQDAAQAAKDLSFPLVAKAVGSTLTHKSEQGGVVLNIDSLGALEEVCQALLKVPGAEGLLVEEQIIDGVAEIIVGVTRDPVFGHCLMVGAGGVLTELLDDKAIFLLPLGEEELRDGLSKLRIWPLLRGYRGKPSGDIDALVAAILTLAEQIDQSEPSVDELDINPIILRPAGRGVVAVDGLVCTEGSV